ncbi:SDR family NAD(P)-dependent oxidoreductase [Demequina sp. NBRC 110053]|uniref:SDR family NAD(P)-dependent oxidoreductase n=1 Tax=Demequina sp. NBRC 110053 TaxID=1570342 RepID=UPI0009FF9E0B|nr:SDR family NAD(P)-dependent oxidoreductase [Demequina sp. NBRC 110053]
MHRIIDSPFTAHHTAEGVSQGADLSGKRAVVTGGASGIGVETVRVLAARGAEVTIAARDLEDAARVAEEISSRTDGRAVQVKQLEHTDRASVVRFAEDWTGPLDLLINNAGVMRIPELTRDGQGHEMQLSTNYLGHADLTLRLRGALAAAGDGARVIMVSSSGHLFSPVVFEDVDIRFRPYDPLTAYGQAKTAEVLLAVGIAHRWADDGIVAHAVNPGAIATRLQRHVGGTLATPAHLQKTVEQGASTTVLAAVSPLLAAGEAQYLSDNAPAHVVEARPDGPEEIGRSVARYALDPDGADRLWTLSQALLGHH